MKKALLLSAIALIGTASAMALDPQVVPNQTVYHYSADGNWAASEDFYAGTVTATNIVTGESYVMEIEGESQELHVGVGNCISNHGTMVFSREYDCNDAHYMKDGVEYILPKAAGFKCAWANAITADDRVIVGAGGYSMYNGDYSADHAVFPMVWTLQGDGTYGEPELLDYPTKDLFGIMPITILVDFISNDGRTIAGQVVANTGMFQQDIVWSLDDEGKWSYKILAEELYHPEGIDYPGPEPLNNYPDPADYMSEQERTAYQAALDYYDKHWSEGAEQPFPEDYMTAEEYSAWEVACEEYYEGDPSQYDLDEAEWQKWNKKNTEYFNAIPNFSYNSVALSGNGQFFLSGEGHNDGESDPTGIAYLFDLSTDKYEIKKIRDTVIIPVEVSDKGTIVAYEQIFPGVIIPTFGSYIAERGENFSTIQDYMHENYPEIYYWMEKNMMHDYTTSYYDYELDKDVEETFTNVWFVGQPRINADGSVIGTWIENRWDYGDDPNYYYSYIMPMSNFVGIDNISADSNANALSLSIDRSGVITIQGEAKALNVYDLNGRLMLNVENPGATVKTNLTPGSYVIKAENADTEAVAKAVL